MIDACSIGIGKYCVVTGGAGFIGSHLCAYLLERGYHVTCIDSLLTGSISNIARLHGERFTFRKHNITHFISLDSPVDYLFHLASPASPVDFERLPIPILKVGALGTHNVLGLAKDKKARFLLASTSEVYGDPLVHPQFEAYWGNVNPVGIRGVYDEAKRFAEALTMAYHRVHHLKTRIVRIFNTYGPRMRIDDGRAVPSFITQALRGEPITIFGDGRQTRSFCYVDDMVEGLYRLMMSDVTEPVNIGNPGEMTMLELARVILELTGRRGTIIHKPLPIDDPKVRQPDISRARSLLHWEPRTPLTDGLRHTIAYFRRVLSES
jgi:dTDP-glucose 4,6-dehydratase